MMSTGMLTTREKLLGEAERLMCTNGVNAFSFADLSQSVGIRKASIHHHFATKEELCTNVVDAYVQRFTEGLAEIERLNADVISRLRLYSRFFTKAKDSNQLPLCGALAAEFAILPESLRSRTQEFFRLHLNWLEKVIRESKDQGVFKPELDPHTAAFTILSLLEGASFVAWSLGDLNTFDSAFDAILEGFS